MSTSPIEIEPASGSYDRTSSRPTVDFPLPLAPTMATRSPGRTVSEKPSRTGAPSA